jgi:ABC-type dipeptide/oligopeptide/nickel transport system ATPase subunit
MSTWLLHRICGQNWYLIDAMDIEIRGASAFVGPSGSGKTSLQDLVQTVHQGNNHNRLHLNPSASGRSERTVREYCLGMTKDPAEGGKPLRESCETVIALVYRNSETNEPLTIGLALSARLSDSREEVLSRFILKGYAYSVNDAKRRDGTREYLAPWSEISDLLRNACPSMEEYKTSAEKFTADVLKIMRTSGQAPNVRQFQRTFSNALAFKPIFDSTGFVREFVLEPEPLDVERVRTSISTWQDLEKIINDIEARLRRVSRLSERFRNWGRARLRAEASRLASMVAECRRAAHDVSGLGETWTRKNGELQVEKKALQTRRQYVRELDEEYRSKQMLAQAGGEAARLNQLEMEGQWIEREVKSAEARFSKLRSGLSNVAQLSPVSELMTPRQSRAVKAAQECLAMIPDGRPAAEALRGKGDRVQELVDEVMSIEGLDVFLHEKADALADEVRQLQAESERLEGMLASAGKGQALLSQPVMKLLSALSRKGMDPVPICDVVEIVDEEWQDAVETLLGWGREAIIVSPERLNEAYDIMHRERDLYAGCTLVKTNVTRKGGMRYPEGSILEAVSSDNPHALSFITMRVGSFLKAYTDDELMSIDRGVTRTGKTTSGMGLSVQANLRQRMLGRAARANTAETLRNEVAPLHEKLVRARQSLRLMREAGRMIPAALDDLRAAQSAFELEHSVKTLANRQAALLEASTTTVSHDSQALLNEIQGIDSDRRLYIREIEDEIEPAVERLQSETATARAKLDSAIEGLKRALKERKKAWQTLSSPELQKLLELDAEIDELAAPEVLRRIRSEIRRGESEKKDARQWLASMRTDQKLIADNNETEARREQSAAVRELSEYAVNWQADVPEIDSENMTVGYVWTMGEKLRLERNELRRYREECERASDEMKRMLKEDLLARLAEKLIKVQHRIDALNALLDKHWFIGQVYSLESSVNQAFRRMHDLAMKIGGQHDAGDVPSLDDAEIADAVAELEGMIEGGEDTMHLADYRKYFTFEIMMTDRSGGRTSLSSRAVKGSGGEAQAPFYVLIAVSLASMYFPGHNSGMPSGMGLAMFDEAFNKLDVPNTQALLKFFKDMGLQLLIAGPEDKRATFTEVLDTIILVNKNLEGTSVYIDSEHPMEQAKAALEAINPDHRSIDEFRTQMPPAAE